MRSRCSLCGQYGTMVTSAGCEHCNSPWTRIEFPVRRRGKSDAAVVQQAYCDGYAAGLEAAAKFVEGRYKCQDAKAATWFGDAIRALNEDTTHG